MLPVSKIGLPPMETEPRLDWTIEPGKNHSLILSYACHRDFLSVPRTHQIVILTGDPTEPARIESIDDQMQSTLDKLNHDESEPGLYILEDEASEDKAKWVLIEKENIFLLLFSHYNCASKHYHQISAKEALDDYLNQEGSDLTDGSTD